MPFKCHSNQIAIERYDYTMAAGENILLPVKARRNEVIIVHCISIYNNSQVNYTLLYKVMEKRGRLCRLNYQAALNAGVVHRFCADNYLIEGDEAGIALTPAAAGDTVQITFQYLRLRDDEFYKSI